MADYRRGAHTVFEIHLHLVWITKYRRPALSGEVATRVRHLIRDICAQHEVKGPRAFVCIDPAARNDQSTVAVVEREDGTSSAGRISAFEKTVLGGACGPEGTSVAVRAM
jgi:Transposase IS200 like